jgi:predicted DNA-binding protein YlxM (UPF0122 family)
MTKPTKKPKKRAKVIASKPPEHSKEAIQAHPAPDRDDYATPEAYVRACRVIHRLRNEYGQPKKTARQRLDAFGIDQICELTADGWSMRRIAEEIGVSWATMVEYVKTDKAWVEQYTRAREAQADKMVEDLLELADRCRLGKKVTNKGDGTTETVTADMVERSRLQIDARKWLAGKMAPKRYGDKLDVEHSGNIIVNRVHYGTKPPEP